VFVVLALAAGLVLSPGTRSAWPFAHWWLYHEGVPTPAREVSVVELRATDTAGAVHRLWPRDLFTLDDDSSSQDSGPWLVGRALDTGDPHHRDHERALWRRVEHLLGAELQEIELHQLTWAVDFTTHPPIQVERPAQDRALRTIFRGD